MLKYFNHYMSYSLYKLEQTYVVFLLHAHNLLTILCPIVYIIWSKPTRSSYGSMWVDFDITINSRLVPPPQKKSRIDLAFII